jgi:hypothetical protein
MFDDEEHWARDIDDSRRLFD